MSEQDNNFAWDDSILIKSYDDSVNLAREELARRIADSTNRRAELNNEQPEATGASTTPEPVGFKVGDYARATYTDGMDYEGAVMSINEETGVCVLRYLGYENEQEVPLGEMLPSWGKKARREQYLLAKQDEAAEEKQKEKKALKGKQAVASSSSFAAGLRMPPAPPLPPMFNPAGGLDGEAGQDLAAMLMSWYMSGYYTGLYQGKLQAGSGKQKKAAAKK